MNVCICLQYFSSCFSSLFFLVPPTEKPTLLFTSSMNVQHVMMNGDEISNSSFSPTGYQIEAMDFNHRNGSYCWVCNFF